MANYSPNSEDFIKPEQVVGFFDLEKGDHVADFGAGHGFFAVIMARKVGASGKVYAIDIQKDTLEVVRKKARLESILNLETIWSDLEHPQGLGLKDNHLDFILISNVLFQAENKSQMLKEANRLLRPGGKLAIIEWENMPSVFGPPLNQRVSKDDLKNMANRNNLEVLREFPAGSHHYGLLFKKK